MTKAMRGEALGADWYQLMSQSGNGAEELWTVRQVAEHVGMHEKTVYKWVESGQLTCLRVGKRGIRFRRSDITRWLASRKE